MFRKGKKQDALFTAADEAHADRHEKLSASRAIAERLLAQFGSSLDDLDPEDWTVTSSEDVKSNLPHKPKISKKTARKGSVVVKKETYELTESSELDSFGRAKNSFSVTDSGLGITVKVFGNGLLKIQAPRDDDLEAAFQPDEQTRFLTRQGVGLQFMNEDFGTSYEEKEFTVCEPIAYLPDDAIELAILFIDQALATGAAAEAEESNN